MTVYRKRPVIGVEEASKLIEDFENALRSLTINVLATHHQELVIRYQEAKKALLEALIK